MANQFKKYFFILALLQIFTAYLPAYAQTTSYDYSQGGKNPISSQIKEFLCAPSEPAKNQTQTNLLDKQGNPITFDQNSAAFKNNNSGDLYKCINQLYKFAIILAGVVGVFFVVIAGYVYMSAEGNQESVDKAKSILTSTIASLVILMSGFLLLKAINPDLIQFKSIQPPSVKISTTTPSDTGGTPTDTGGGTVSGDTKTAASTIISMVGTSLFINASDCDCSGNCPNKTLQDLAAGKKAVYDAPTSCNAGTTDVSSKMLNALITLANSGTKFTIQSLTGGHHGKSNNNVNDPHYKGQAVDVTPYPANSNTQETLVKSLRSSGATAIGLECVGGPSNGYLSLTGTNDSNASCIGKSGYHIHAQW